MAETYRRAVFVEPRVIRFDELPIPEPGPYQVLVRVKACALCTWEQRSYTGEEQFYPVATGHEVSGELVKLGSKVFADVQPGDRVVASMLLRCGYCDSCRRGMDNICDNAYAPFRDRDVVGPAGLAEYVLLEDYQLFRAGEDVPFEELCLAEPLACVIRSIHKAAVGPADNVVVVGAGIMGILHVILAKRAGARVLVSEPNGVRSAFALGMGADAIIDPTDESFVDKVKAWTAGRGADAILCAVSVGAVLEQAVEAVAKGGRVHVFASIHPRGTRISIDPNPFHSREIVLTGTMSQDKDDMRQAVEMISRGSIDLKPFISHMVPLKQLEEGLKAALRPDTYRVVVRP
jgi:2-desacetyl-2-hydroxyethyl bacteriochlorophyllide A dehydrogenase